MSVTAHRRLVTIDFDLWLSAVCSSASSSTCWKVGQMVLFLVDHGDMVGRNQRTSR